MTKNTYTVKSAPFVIVERHEDGTTHTKIAIKVKIKLSDGSKEWNPDGFVLYQADGVTPLADASDALAVHAAIVRRIAILEAALASAAAASSAPPPPTSAYLGAEIDGTDGTQITVVAPAPPPDPTVTP